MPAVVAAVALAAEPALIATDDFADERAGIDGLGLNDTGEDDEQFEEADHAVMFSLTDATRQDVMLPA
jgi:hypothetical protein